LTFPNPYVRILDMKCLILILALLTSLANAGTLRVAVVDSGLNIEDSRFSKHICSTGHKNFTNSPLGLTDSNGHGTAIVSLIEQYAGDGDYCLVIYKYYQSSDPGPVNFKHEIEAFEEATKNKSKIINFSGGGPEFNEKEYLVVRENPTVLFVVAAGNENKDLDIPGNEFYPASYNLKNEITVGNVDKNNKRAISSNYGKKVITVEIGENVDVAFPESYGNASGTSVSTAIHTGKLIRIILNATH
jgi:thermitase